MNKTAVEWLLEHLERNIMWTDEAEKIAEQAKEMEKQQIFDAVEYFYEYPEEAEQYYNETFKSK